MSKGTGNIFIAGEDEIEDIVRLLNSAYRGESSKAGWTTEAHLIDGNIRTDSDTVKKFMQLPDSVFLICKQDGETLNGCVNLQKHQDKLYLGMLAVSPVLQGKGTGKKLLQAAEEFAKVVGCNSIYMTVISQREELIDWYKRHGYRDTGRRQPFSEDGKSGHHLRKLEFLVLEKMIS